MPVPKPYPGRAAFSDAEKLRRIQRHRDVSDYFSLLGLRLLDLAPGWSLMELPFRREITHSGGVVQGGVITTLADSSLAHATMAALDFDTHGTTTIELKINFIRPALGGVFTSEARLIHLGRRTAVGEAEITNDSGKLVAKCLASLMIFEGGDRAPP